MGLLLFFAGCSCRMRLVHSWFVYSVEAFIVAAGIFYMQHKAHLCIIKFFFYNEMVNEGLSDSDGERLKA